MKFSFSILQCLLFTLLLTAFIGCGKKTDTKYIPAEPGKTPPTQRPYKINGKKYHPIPSALGYREKGVASWYGKKFHGRKTSNGETYDMYGHTAAHKTLPMNTVLQVNNLENGKSIVVRVNDRGPFVKERIIDLTYTGAKELGILRNGTGRVEIVAMQPDQKVARATVQKPVPTTAKPQPQPEPKPVVRDFDKGNFYVQVGAFGQIGNARKLAKVFAERGRDVVIQQYPAAGMDLYRVMVYCGTSLAFARQYERYLEANGFANALVIAR